MHSIFWSFTSIDFVLLYVVETHLLWSIYFFEVVSADFKSAGKTDFVVAVVASDDSIVVAKALVYVGVESLLRLVGCAVE